MSARATSSSSTGEIRLTKTSTTGRSQEGLAGQEGELLPGGRAHRPIDDQGEGIVPVGAAVIGEKTDDRPVDLRLQQGLAGPRIAAEQLDRQLRRRMGGYGRGGRMAIEKDRAEITGGLRFGKTLGSPIALTVRNLDHENWLESMRKYDPRRS